MKYPIILLMAMLSFKASASDLTISEPILYQESGEAYAVFNLHWENAWHNARNHDAVWLHFKFLKGTKGYDPVKVSSQGHAVTNYNSEKKPQLDFDVPKDGTGVFVFPGSDFRGDIDATIKVYLDTASFRGIRTRDDYFDVFGLEMVEIPGGGFYLGDPDTASLAFGSLFISDNNGEPKGLYEIKREDQSIDLGPENGNLYFRTPRKYEGDPNGNIPSTYPKGVSPFYIMKYEPTQGQYAEFLNTLNDYQSQNRSNFGGKNYYSHGGSISIEKGKYQAGSPNAPCNYMSWDDAMAFADWSCLRPMTEFEFTKAARGPGEAMAKEYPWGSGSKDRVQRRISVGGELTMLNGWDESQLSDATKDLFAASYYWVMDLSGSLWERVITIGDEKGRAFTGSHGDGKLTYYGFANCKDWPEGIRETGGFGFRGGGFYGYGRDYHEFNPFSPIAYRTFGGWSGGNRTEAYGARFVRRID